MACKPEMLKNVPLFALLDDDELAVLAGQVEVRVFVPRERIYKIGSPAAQAYVIVSGKIRVTTIDGEFSASLRKNVGTYFSEAELLPAAFFRRRCSGASC
jgi:CRP/FNR family transcriptional regulator, cyclic AMP receptor protein